MMSFVVTNLPNNDFAVNNSVYLPRSKKGAPTVKINEKYFKCAFAEEMEPNKIGLSKNIRDYLGIELNQAVKVEPFQAANIEELDLSYLELELTQMKPKIEGQGKVSVDDEAIIKALREQENGSYFNLQQAKYLRKEGTLYSVRVLKGLLMLTGTGSDDRIKQTSRSGRLNEDTQIELKVPEKSPLALQSKESQGKNMFRPDFTIEDMGIGGLDEELFNIFRRTFASRRYSSSTIKRFGVKHVKGILLYGPPGTGKTLIARQLAKALNVKDLKIVNGPQLFSKYVGESEENVRKLFQQARNDEAKLGDKSPLHIIVFDQIDAICKQRGMHSGGGSQVTDQVVNQLLTNIDGVESLNNIIVIGMTNRKDLLDEAILRPGRFEVHIEINLPNAEGRQQILGIHTKRLRSNNLLSPDCRLDELARLTKNFTGAELEALVKCASSHSLSRTTNILDFSKELIIDENKLQVEMQDFLKALEEVKPQFGVDEEKFVAYFREKITNYGPGYDRVMSSLRELAVMNPSQKNQKRSVLLAGRQGTGKTMLAIDFVRHCSFSYLKIISPQNYVGMSDSQKIRNISKVFEDAYRTVNACIVIDSLERLIDYCAVGCRFNNAVLQALLLLLDKASPKEECRLIIIGTTSVDYRLQRIDLSSRFDVTVQVMALKQRQIEAMLREKYGLKEEIAAQVGKIVHNCTISELLQLAELVDNKKEPKEWEFYWQNLVGPRSKEESEI